MTQRTTKFRIWDSIHRHFVWLELRGRGFIYGETAEGSSAPGSLEPPQQFTGLHDKNGKEIWEGDVVRYPNNNAIMGARGPLGDRTFQKHVVYFQGAFRCMQEIPDQTKVTFTHTPGDYITGDIYWGIEVIGNIYENPDLLTDQNTDEA